MRRLFAKSFCFGKILIISSFGIFDNASSLTLWMVCVIHKLLSVKLIDLTSSPMVSPARMEHMNAIWIARWRSSSSIRPNASWICSL